MVESLYYYYPKNKVKRLLDLIKGKANPEKSIDEIWEDDKELCKSNAFKYSFKELISKLEKLEFKLRKKKDPKVKELLDQVGFYNVPNFFFTMEESILENKIIKKILGNPQLESQEDKIKYKENVKFVLTLLSQFNFVIPKKKQSFTQYGKYFETKREYIVPLFFPEKPPLMMEILDVQFCNEWKITYYLPFKPSSIWKLLFMRIRQSIVESEEKREISKENYW